VFAVAGGSGYVGSWLCRELERRKLPWIAIERQVTAVPTALADWLEKVRPSAVINAAGFTGKPNVDACELQKAECLAGNCVLPGTFRMACTAVGIPWGHVSSGCIYSGRRPDGDGFRETDPPNFSFRQDNCSFYSGCKALGEEVLHGADACYVWRPRMPFEWTNSPRNYLAKLLHYPKLLDAENSLTYLPEFAAACIDCFEKKLPFGIYNLTNPGAITTRKVVEWMKDRGVSDKAFEFFADESEFLALAAKTPRSNCVLDSSKAVFAGLKLSPVEDAIQECLERWQS
jgi:dTDP-4-dehydrorhamnose reductase